MSKLTEYFELAQGLYDSYADRNTLYANIDKMFYMDWDFPAGMPDWVMKAVSTEPHDAILTTVRTFATLKPRFKVMPMMNDEANRNRANEIEAAISHNFKQASRRNDASVTWDVMLSASLYAEVGAQVIYLPYQEKILHAMAEKEGATKSGAAMRAKARRTKAARRFGDFAFIVHHPGNLFPEYSEYGLEGNLTCRVQAVDEFLYTWGDRAKAIVSMRDYEDGKITYVTSWDYTNYEERCVWGVCSETADIRIEGQGVTILEEENKLGFIPYAIKRWGNSLSADPQERVMPLLQPIYNSGRWDALNVLESLDVSLTIKRASQPQYAGEFPPGQDPEIDNTEPVGVLKNPAGTRNFTPLPPQSADQRLTMEKNQYKSESWQMMVARVLNSLDFGSGTAYSQSNQVLTQAANSLAPYRVLGENAMAELAHLMLCWGKYYDKEYNDGKGTTSLYGQYEDKTRMGKEISIPFNTIDPDALQIEVVLTPDTAIDRLQQINGAVMIKNNFRVPEAELLEDLGLGDPNELAKRRDLEDYKQSYIQADLKRIAMQPDLEAAQQQMEMQAGMAQQQNEQAMAQEQADREQEAAAAAAQQGGTPAQEQMAGMNPAAGSMPPVQMANGQR